MSKSIFESEMRNLVVIGKQNLDLTYQNHFRNQNWNPNVVLKMF